METLQLLLDGQRDNDWLERNRSSIEENFKGMYVAIKDEQVVASDKDMECVIKAVEDKGLDPALILVTFITSEDQGVFL